MYFYLSSADVFSKLSILKNSFRITIKVSNSFDPDLAVSGSKLFAKIISRGL